jgi:uncharacterized damage-inducible protein DinB
MRPAPPESLTLEEVVLPAWETNARVTRLLLAGLRPALWNQPMPGASRRTIRMIAAHLHNARCGWVRTLGQPHGIRVPPRVDRSTVSKAVLLKALTRSAAAIGELLRFGCSHGGRIPPTRVYVWRNLALDVGHVLTYFVAHEGHHRGQLSLLARQLGAPLPETTRNRVWWWKPPPG